MFRSLRSLCRLCVCVFLCLFVCLLVCLFVCLVVCVFVCGILSFAHPNGADGPLGALGNSGLLFMMSIVKFAKLVKYNIVRV